MLHAAAIAWVKVAPLMFAAGSYFVLLPLTAGAAEGDPVSDQETVQWQTGARVEQQLEQQVGVSWSGTPVRQALTSLSRTQKVAVLLDRRIDPSQAIDLRISGKALREALLEIATQLHAGYAQLGPVAYIGPIDAAKKLTTIAEFQRQGIAKLPIAMRTMLGQKAAWRWEDLTTPQELLDQIAGPLMASIAGREQIPHDLLAGGDLPPLTLLERLTLLVVQFDLMLEPSSDGSGLSLVKIPAKLVVNRTFNLGRRGDSSGDALKQRFPHTQFDVKDNRVTVTGLVDDLNAIAASLNASRSKTNQATEGRQAHTLKIRMARLDQVLKKLEDLELTFEIDEAALQQAEIRLDTLVSVDVKDVDLDELLSAILNPVGLQFRRTGNAVEIFSIRSSKRTK